MSIRYDLRLALALLALACVAVLLPAAEPVAGPAIQPLDQVIGVRLLTPGLVFRKVVPKGPRCANAGCLDLIPAPFLGQYSIVCMRGDYTKPGSGYQVELSRSKWVYLCVVDRGNTAIPAGWQKLYEKQNWGGNVDSIYEKLVQPGVLDILAHIGTADGKTYGAPHMLVLADTEIVHFVPNDIIEPVSASIMLDNVKLNGPRCSDKYTILSLPGELEGLDSIFLPRGNYGEPGAGYTFKVSKPVFVYLSVMDRGTTPLGPGWEDLDRKLVWGVGPNAYLDSLFVKTYPAGLIEIPPHMGNGPPHLAMVATSRVLNKREDGLVGKIEGQAFLAQVKKGCSRVAGSYPFREVPRQFLGAEYIAPLAVPSSTSEPIHGFCFKVLRDVFVYLGVADRGLKTATPTIPAGWKDTGYRSCWASISSDTIYVQQFKAGVTVEVPANDGKPSGDNYGQPCYCVVSASNLFPVTAAGEKTGK